MQTVELISKALDLGAIQVPEEIAALVELVKSHASRNIMEIGSEAGGTFYLWCRLTPLGGIKISLDLPSGDSGSGKFRDPTALQARATKMRSWSANVHVVTGDSHEQRSWRAVDDILGRGREKLDFLFIDGDHSYEGVKLDFEDYRGFVRPGGLIAFHDIKDTEYHRKRGCFVAKFWQQLISDPLPPDKDQLFWEFTHGPDWGGIGVVRV